MKSKLAQLALWCYDLSRAHKSVMKTHAMRDAMVGKSILIVGNGPSAKTVPPKFIKDWQSGTNHLMTMNTMPFMDERDCVIPDFHVLADPKWKNFLKEKPAEQEALIYRSNQKLIQLGVNVWVPMNWVDDPRIKPVSKKLSFFSTRRLGRANKPTNVLLPPNSVAWTGVRALNIAVYLGYREIYLIGFDNTHFRTLAVNEKNEVVRNPEHFYNDQKNGYVHNNNLESLLFAQVEALSFYRNLARLISRQGRRIYNIQKDSFIDCIEKMQEIFPYEG